MRKLLFGIVSILSIQSTTGFGSSSGLEFSPEEIESSLQNSKVISEVAATCIDRTFQTHTEFFKKRGYSKFYGNRHPKHKTEMDRRKVLLSILPSLRNRINDRDPKAPAELTKRVKELESTSCVGLAMQCLGEGFQAAGMGETWDKIFVWLGRPGHDGAPMHYGTDLQKALVDLGWKSLYWNPDISQNSAWEKSEAEINPLEKDKKWNPIWGGHSYRLSLVLRDRDYYGVPVHDIQTLVNFGISPPAEFKSIPFFLGTAHSGYHVFPGTKGNVIEAHSMRELKSESNLEMGEFNPLDQPMNGQPNGRGAPVWTRHEHYRSGIIVVPPGYIADKPFEVPGPAMGAPTFLPKKPEKKEDYNNEMWGLPGILPWNW